MPNSYLPQTDSGLLNWSENFSTKINAIADPTVIGLTSAQPGEYAAAQSVYATAYAAAVDPDTEGRATILAKNEAKRALVALSRQMAMAVTNHAGVTNEMRQSYGLTVRDPEPTPVPVPEDSPNIDILSVSGYTIKFRLYNGESTSRAKPVGVKGATLFSYVGDAPPTDLGAWKFEGNVSTTTKLSITVPGTVAAGSKVWVTSFWFNTRNESGPATPPVSTNIQGGGLSQAA